MSESDEKAIEGDEGVIEGCENENKWNEQGMREEVKGGGWWEGAREGSRKGEKSGMKVGG